MNIEYFNPETPKILIQALRQYQHNDCSGLLAGFDYDDTVRIVSELESVIQKCFDYACKPSGKVSKKTALLLMKYADTRA